MTSATKNRIAIVGRGIAGLTLCSRFLREGFHPILIGQHFSFEGASRCAQGIVASKGLFLYDSPLFRAKLEGQAQIHGWLKAIETESRQTITREFSGIYEPYNSEEEFQFLVRRLYRGKMWGCFQTNNISQAAIPKFPFSVRASLGALFYPQDGWIDVQELLRAMETINQLHGVEAYNEKVKGIFIRANDELVIALESGHQISCDQVVIAAGSNTPQLLTALGIEVPKYFIVGGQTLELGLSYSSSKPLSFVSGLNSATWCGSRFICGSSSWKGSTISVEEVVLDTERLIHIIEEKFGLDLSAINSQENRMGNRFRFADRMPAVGPLKTPKFHNKLHLFSGFYKSGVQLAHLCAEDMVHHIKSEPDRVRFPDFLPDRIFKI